MALHRSKSFLLCTICFVVVASVAAIAADPKVTTVAGGFVGDGKVATSASLAEPVAVVQDAKGNVYISDSLNCRIRKINKAGIIHTFAGTGICGYSGDGGKASVAMITNAAGIALDVHGNLLFADSGNNRIRQITPAGIITTVAGNGTSGYSGDEGPAVSASLAGPTAVSVDATSGKIYIADTSNYVIRMVDSGGIIHTVAGNHSRGFSGDNGPATSAQIGYASDVLADQSGNFYIGDGSNARVRKVDSSGTITTYAGNGRSGNTGSGGPATSASIGGAAGLYLQGGNLYISATVNIWAVTLSNQIINIVAGTSVLGGGFNGDGKPALSTLFCGPRGMASDGAGGLIVADFCNNRVRRIASSQVVTTIGGGYVGDGGPGMAASLNSPSHMTFDPAGNLYLADMSSNRIRKVTPGGAITTFAGTGITGYSGDGGPATAATLNFPIAVVAGAQGNIYIADFGNAAIRKVDSTGTITTFLTEFKSPNGATESAYATVLAMGPDGSLYAAGIFEVWKVTSPSSATIVAGVFPRFGYNGDGIPATQAWLYIPNGLAFDGAGNLYISDSLNNRIRKVDTSGIISTYAGTGQQGFGGDGGPATSAMIDIPQDVAMDHTGNLYIADDSNARIRVVDSSGTINTYAGTGGVGYNGNNLPATNANLSPGGLTITSKGVLYFSDASSNRVRKVH